MAVSLNSKVEKVVLTIQSDAGRILRQERNEKVLQAKESMFLSNYRPYSFTYVDNSWDWSSRTVVNNNYAAPSDRKKDKEDHTVAIVIGSIVAIVTSFLFGYSVKQYSQASKTARITDRLLLDVIQLKETVANKQLVHNMQLFIGYQKENDDLTLSKWMKYAISSVSGIIGGVACVAGGVSSTPWLITAGAVAILGAFIIGSYTKAVHWDDEETIRENCEKMIKNSQENEEGSIPLADRILLQLSFLSDDLLRHKDDKSEEQAPNQYQAVNDDLYADWLRAAREGYQPLYPQLYRSSKASKV